MRYCKLFLMGGIVLALSSPVWALSLIYEEGPKVGQAFTGGQLVFKLTDYTAGTTYLTPGGGLAPTGYSGAYVVPGLGSAVDLLGVTAVDAVQVAGATGTVAGYATYGMGNTREDTWGIAKVTRIQDNAGNALWTPLGKGAEITAIFYGSQDFYVAPMGPGATLPNSDRIDAAGLQVSMWEQPLPAGVNTFDPTLGTGGRNTVNTYTTVAGVGEGTNILTLAALPGFLNDNGTGGGLNTEFEAEFDFASLVGKGHSYMEVTGGTLATTFDTNGYPVFLPGALLAGLLTPADVQIQFNSVPNPAPPDNVGDWVVISDDPARFSAVPEPATMAGVLMGIGCLGRYIRKRR